MAQLHAAPQRPALALATIALLPEDRAALHRRIEQRFDAMLAQRATRRSARRCARAATSIRTCRRCAASATGRRGRHLDGQTDFAAFRAAGIAATRQLAKRQITWLRSMRDATRIDPFAADAYERVRAAVEAIEGAT